MTGVEEVWPGCLIQFEDFKQHNALRILDRYQGRVPSLQRRHPGHRRRRAWRACWRGCARPAGRWRDARIVLVGAGAAGIGIARLLRMAMREDGLAEDVVRDRDRAGRHAGPGPRGTPRPGRLASSTLCRGRAGGGRDAATCVATVRARRPKILVGATGVAGTFSEAVIRAMAEALGPDERPIVLPLSNPTVGLGGDPGRRHRLDRRTRARGHRLPFAPVELDGVAPRRSARRTTCSSSRAWAWGHRGRVARA